MKMTAGLRIWVVGTLTALAAVSGQGQDMKTYKGIYEKNSEEIRGNFQPKFDGLHQQYKKSMEALKAAAQNQGDLAKIKAVIAEIERFQKAKAMPAAPEENALPIIKSFQSDYVKQYLNLEGDMIAQLGALTVKYEQALERLQKELVRSGKLDEATGVQQERDRAKTTMKGYTAQWTAINDPAAKPNVTGMATAPKPATVNVDTTARPAAQETLAFTCMTNNGMLSITKYTGPGGTVILPDSINNLPVTGIEGYAFKGCTALTSVKIPASVTRIGWGPFSYCTGLTSVIVNAENPAFCNDEDGVLYNKNKSYLVSFPAGKGGCYVIPSSVTQLACSSFMGCSKLTSVTIPDSINRLGNGSVFVGCTGLTNVSLPNTITFIGSWEFSDCTGLTTMTIPAGVINIGQGTFRRCTNLKTVFFRGNAPELGKHVFLDTRKVIIYYRTSSTGWGKEVDGRPTAVWK